MKSLLSLMALSAGLCHGATQGNCGSLCINGVAIAADSNQPTYVRHAIGELQSYLAEMTGEDVRVAASAPTGQGVVITVGCGDRDELGEEGFSIKTSSLDGRDWITITGGTGKGTKFGVYALMKMIRCDGRRAYLNTPVNVVSKPSFPLRGMHLNGWPINSPYGFRKWREDDWKRYIDILSSQGANLLYIWPFMEIIPLPLSKQDEAYLQEFRRVVDYAQREHGMEVWMMQSANRVATSNLGIADPRERPYWKKEFQVDLNPADPEQFRKIMESREALYRIVNNVDGVCTIDSDPGGWKGSPISDYAKILNGCRSLLDRCNIHGRQAKLIDWLWLGWGFTELPAYDVEHHRKTIQAFKKDLPEPWWIICGYEAPLPMCKEEGVLEKTVYLRYGGIENEPAYPGTNLPIDLTKAALSHVRDYPQIGGVMGNAQTPLLQLPRTFFLLRSARDYSSQSVEQPPVLRELADQLYPDNTDLIVECFQALQSQDEGQIRLVASKLAHVLEEGRLGKPGVIARKMFPSTDFAARNLLVQLRLRAAQEALFGELTAETSLLRCRELIRDYLDAYFAWEKEHGWHEYWDKTYGWGHGWALGRLSEDTRYPALISLLKNRLGDQVRQILQEAASELDPKYDEEDVRKFGTEALANAIETAGAKPAQ